jgi:hypothetical protein
MLPFPFTFVTYSPYALHTVLTCCNALMVLAYLCRQGLSSGMKRWKKSLLRGIYQVQHLTGT